MKLNFRYIYIGVIVVICGLMLYFNKTGGQGRAVVDVIMYVFMAFIVAILALNWLTRRHLLDKGMSALSRACDPETAINEHTRRLEQARAKGNKAAENIYLNNLAVAYHANGETDKALQILRRIPMAADNAASQVLYHGNIAVLNWDKGDYDEFWYEKSIVDRYLDGLNPVTPEYKTMRNQAGRIAARGDILNGEYDRALEFFQRQLEFFPKFDLYARVSNTYIIAGIYFLMGDMPKYREALDFVANNGNKLYAARLARQRLAMI